MACGQCGATNRDGARFCSGCGSALALKCAECGAGLGPNARFCDQCGSPVAGTPAPAATATPSAPAETTPTPSAPGVAVRKTVTLLFADLGGSTSFGERTDAELARTVMAEYHALLQRVVDAHGGTVAKFMGDGMMATFGIPETAEDDAARAVTAGAALQQRFLEFAADVEHRYRETLTLRVGNFISFFVNRVG